MDASLISFFIEHCENVDWTFPMQGGHVVTQSCFGSHIQLASHYIQRGRNRSTKQAGRHSKISEPALKACSTWVLCLPSNLCERRRVSQVSKEEKTSESIPSGLFPLNFPPTKPAALGKNPEDSFIFLVSFQCDFINVFLFSL